MKLNIGCGNRHLPGFTRIDNREETKPDMVANALDLRGYQDDSVEIVYASHILEHIPRPKLLDALREWRRVLEPGGIVRIAVPDFRILAELYLYQAAPLWRVIGPLYGRQDYEGNTHHIAFDYHYLAWHLTEAGFYNIRYWCPVDVLPEGYDDFSLATIDGELISLCLEATAP